MVQIEPWFAPANAERHMLLARLKMEDKPIDFRGTLDKTYTPLVNIQKTMEITMFNM